MRKEVDLTHEAKNAEETARFLRGDKELRDKVTVPKVEWKWTGESVMTAEYVPSSSRTPLNITEALLNTLRYPDSSTPVD